MLAYRSCASETSVRLPNSASASSKNRIALLVRASAKMRARFFSVSPMYLLTTPDRSTLYRSSPTSPGQHLGRHRLAGAGRPAEQHAEPGAVAELRRRTPSARRPGGGAAPGRRSRAGAPTRSAGRTRSSQPQRGSTRTARSSSFRLDCCRHAAETSARVSSDGCGRMSRRCRPARPRPGCGPAPSRNRTASSAAQDRGSPGCARPGSAARSPYCARRRAASPPPGGPARRRTPACPATPTPR